MKIYTIHEVDKILEEIVVGAGDSFFYERPDGRLSCLYTVNGSPSCIVGHLLHHLGYTVPENSSHNSRRFMALPPEVWEEAGFGFDGSAALHIDLVQRFQDCGEPWSGALIRSRLNHSRLLAPMEVAE